jgi:hypothetical protein
MSIFRAEVTKEDTRGVEASGGEIEIKSLQLFERRNRFSTVGVNSRKILRRCETKLESQIEPSVQPKICAVKVTAYSDREVFPFLELQILRRDNRPISLHCD